MNGLLRRGFGLLWTLIGALASLPAMAQEFPAKPIRIIVANSAGTIADLAARLLGQEMSKILGQPIIVEAKPGANQIIGLDYVLAQPADGYTTILSYNSPMATLPVIVKDLKFDPQKDLRPLTTIFSIRAYLVAPTKRSWANFNDMVADVKSNPGKMNYGSNNVAIRLVFEAMLRDLSLNVVHIPFSGAGPLIQGVATDQVQLVITNEANLISFKDSIRPLAITGDARLPRYANLPTLKELGIPHMRNADYTLSIRSETPRPVSDKLYAAALQALKAQPLLDGFGKLGFEAVGDTPEAAARKLADEAATYAEVAKRVGLKPE